MTPKNQYEKNSDAFAPYYYDDENHIDSLTPLESLRTHDFAGRRRLDYVIIDDDIVHRATFKLIVKHVTWTSSV